MIEFYEDRVIDTFCGMINMFVQSERFFIEHGGRLGDIEIIGQESNLTTTQITKLAVDWTTLTWLEIFGQNFVYDREILFNDPTFERNAEADYTDFVCVGQFSSAPDRTNTLSEDVVLSKHISCELRIIDMEELLSGLKINGIQHG